MKPTHIRKTNQQLLKEIMSFSRFGPLAEAFVMDAIARAAEAVAAGDPKDYPANWPGVAKEVKARLDAHFAPLDEQKAA